MARINDTALVRKAQAGDLKAFDALVSLHERRVYGMALRLTGSEHDAQDVTQQVFLAAIKNLSAFRGTAAFSTWLSKITVRSALKLLDKQRRRNSESFEVAVWQQQEGAAQHPELVGPWRETPGEILKRAETGRLLDEAMAELPAGQKAVFLLRDVEGFSVADTARALGLSQANVKVRLVRARIALREKLARAFAGR